MVKNSPKCHSVAISLLICIALDDCGLKEVVCSRAAEGIVGVDVVDGAFAN